MECEIYIGSEIIGKVTFDIIDQSMGAISGELLCNENYHKYQKTIQKQTAEKGISNSENYNYRIVTKNNIELKPEGGIGISDSCESRVKILSL